MLQIADEVLLHLQVALVDRGDPRQVVHLLQDRTIRIVGDRALGVAPAEARDLRPGDVVGDVLDGEVELVAGDEVHDRRLDQAAVRLHRDLGADQAGLEVRVDRLQRLNGLHVRLERRHRGVDHHQVEVLGHGRDVRQALAVRRGVDELGLLHQGGRLGQPGRVPERADLPFGLVARAGAAVETVEGRRLEKQGPEHWLGPRRERRFARKKHETGLHANIPHGRRGTPYRLRTTVCRAPASVPEVRNWPRPRGRTGA